MQDTAGEVLIRSEAESDLEFAVKAFLQKVSHPRCICFWGGLGAGKTTFIRALCKYLGVVDVVTSPTFALINEYHCTDGAFIYHCDFYRLNALQEALDIGIEDYLANDKGRCLIEWPAIVEPILPETLIHVAIVPQLNGQRILKIGAKS